MLKGVKISSIIIEKTGFILKSMTFGLYNFLRLSKSIYLFPNSKAKALNSILVLFKSN